MFSGQKFRLIFFSLKDPVCNLREGLIEDNIDSWKGSLLDGYST